MRAPKSSTGPAPDVPIWAYGPEGLHLQDIPTREGGRLPTFVVIGAAKCGTTALNSYLEQHPEVAMCPHKEPHFFSTDVLYDRGLDWYRGLYAECRPAKAYGEASTSYSRAPEYGVAAERLHDAIPDARLVYLVREPVSRTQSDVLQALKYAEHALGRAAASDSLDVLLERNPVAVHSSEYIVQIRHYLTRFDRSQLLVVLQDDLRDDPHGTLAKIFAFIGVDPSVAVAVRPAENATAGYLDSVRDARLLAKLRRIPQYESIKSWVPAGLKERLKSAMRRYAGNNASLALSPATRDNLKRHFAPFNAELAEFLGRDLGAWAR